MLLKALQLTMPLVLVVTTALPNWAQDRRGRTQPQVGDRPVRTELIEPIRNESFTKNGRARVRKQGGNPRMEDGILMFDGSLDGNRQVDPQIAVGKEFILHGTNSGLIIYDKQGNYVQGVPQSEFNDGIDPKLFYDRHNDIFGFNLWYYYDQPKQKPVNVSVSETGDPRGAWNTYPVPAPNAVDGGGIGFSHQWIGYSYPGGAEQSFVMKLADAKAGRPATVYHFAGNLGEPVHSQDPSDDLYFFAINRQAFVISTITEGDDGVPIIGSIVRRPHGLDAVEFPPQSPQKGTEQKTASGDRNPKRVVLQNDCLWFSHAVNVNGRSAVQWHQVALDGTIIQSGRLAHDINSYIQTTLGVNSRGDVLVGFQETGPDLYISPRCAWRFADDEPGKLREIVSLGEGTGATDGVAWGDYSCTVVDGGNGLDLWTIQSRANDRGRGETVIAKIPFHD